MPGEEGITQFGALERPGMSRAAAPEQSRSELFMAPMRPELLHHNAVIPREVWWPMFGGKELVTGLWNRLVPDKGNFAVIKASSALNLILGGYLIDERTGLVPASCRTDIDVWVPGDIWGNVDRFPGDQHTFAKSVKVGGIGVDLVSAEAQYEFNIGVLKRLYELQQDLGLKGNYHTDVVFHHRGVMRLLHILGKGGKWTSDDGLVLTNADLFATAGFYRYEALGIKVTRLADGELEFRILDPSDCLTGEEMKQMTTREWIEYSLKKGSFPGLRQPEAINRWSVRARTVEVLERNSRRFPDQEIPFEEIAKLELPEFAARGILAVTENQVNLMADLDDPCWSGLSSKGWSTDVTWGSESYMALYSMIYRLQRKGNPWNSLVNRLRVSSRDVERSLEKSNKRTQEKIARAAFSDPAKVLELALLGFPLHDYICPEMGYVFEGFHDDVMNRDLPPSSSLVENLRARGYTNETVPDSFEFPFGAAASERRTAIINHKEPVRILMKVFDIADKHYRKGVIRMGRQEEGVQAVTYSYIQNPPESMSEVIALLFVAAGVDYSTARGQRIIRSAVANWLPSGDLKCSWRRSRDVDFGVGLSETEIIRCMQRFEKYDRVSKGVAERTSAGPIIIPPVEASRYTGMGAAQ